MMTAKKTYDAMARKWDEKFERGEEMEGMVRVNARVGKEPRAVFSLRLSGAELTELVEAANKRNIKVGDFIRTVALNEARGDTDAWLEQLDLLTQGLSQAQKASGSLRRAPKAIGTKT